VDRDVRALRPTITGASIAVEGGLNRPPMPRASAEELFRVAQQCAEELGLGRLHGVVVGGASDGNFTAGIGTPTLDGLGAVGDGAHADGEHVLVASMPERAALLAELIERVRRG
jgi:glutamate carboxypeptidase